MAVRRRRRGSGQQGARRSEGFAVRRWLQLGAASAGVSAGLIGFSLLGPQVGTAAADTAGETTTSASASTSDDTGPAASTDSANDAGDADDADDAGDAGDADAAVDAENADDDLDAQDENIDAENADDQDTDDQDADDEDADDRTSGRGLPEVGVAANDAVVDDSDAGDVIAASISRTEDVVPAAVSQESVPVAVPEPSPGNPSDFAGRAISNWTTSSQGWINALPVDGQAKYHLAGALWATRRTLFNQAPTVAPIQISGKLDGPIVGMVGAVDPEGDRLTYVVTRGPQSGSVHLNSDGTYTYTPGTDFDGVDSFRVVVIDAGPHVNLLDPFRGAGTAADNLVNQRAVSFTFTYRTGSVYWTPERRAALTKVADRLVEYLTVTQPVTVTYDVLGANNATSSTLAWADSAPVSADPGFWRTVVQNKIISGVDSNGAASDGEISFNFGRKWGLGDRVNSDEFDFTSTAIHEILHSFGFMTAVGRAGTNTDRSWLIYDSFIVTADGRRPVGSDHVWKRQYDPYLTGGGGGLFFGGSNAVAAYGGYVPLFTPNPWVSGSSMHHLDDRTFTGANQKVMNAMAGTGPHVRVLSPIEIGILRDLGYRVAAPLVQL